MWGQQKSDDINNENKTENKKENIQKILKREIQIFHNFPFF